MQRKKRYLQNVHVQGNSPEQKYTAHIFNPTSA